MSVAPSQASNAPININRQYGSLLNWLEADRQQHNEQRNPQTHAETGLDDHTPAYVFLQPEDTIKSSNINTGQIGEQPRFTEQRLTHHDLKQRAKSLAAYLQNTQNTQNTCAVGDRAILLYPSGLDYIVAFFACLYAGVIAVPAFPPGARKRDWGRIDAIFSNAAPTAILTTSALQPDINKWQEDNCPSTHVPIIPTDLISEQYSNEWQKPALNGDSIAFLQYSSGSTGTPKGVMVTHANIQHNMQVIGDGFSISAQEKACSWLPIYHDMGLIGSILKPFDAGMTMYLLSPMDVLQKPLRWLQAISDYQLTASGGPNFIYQHCINRIKPEEKQQLDLSSWTLAYNGAEPISRHTLNAFANAFASCGFNANALTPCYGMAETTLMVSSNPRANHFDAIASETGSDISPGVSSGISSGKVHPELEVKIVNPDTRELCATAETGEIWVRGASVASGYWQLDDLTQEVFHANIQASISSQQNNTEYLRTGDLGYLHNGELHVTGRRKELIIIRGQNHYPQDIEATVANSCEELKGCVGAAFSVMDSSETGSSAGDGTEKLVITHEVNRTHMRNLDTEQLLAKVRKAVSAEHQLHIHALVIIKPASLLRTTSGKIRRVSMRDAYLADELKTVFAWHAPSTEQQQANISASAETVQDTLNWLRHYAEQRINSRLIDERRSIPPYIVLDMGNRGLMGLHVPVEQGGAGFSYQQAIEVYQQLGAIDPSLALFIGLGNVLGLRPLQHFGSPAMQQQYLRNIASGRQLAAFAITEPGAGSNPLAMQTTATQNLDGSFTLNGCKIWSGTAAWASVIHVFAKTFDANGNAQGITGFCVERDLAGLRIGEEALTMGMRGTCQSRIELNNVTVPAHAVLGEVGQGMDVAQDAMKFGRLIITACATGGMKRCAQLMLRYAQRREIGTGLLLNNPVTLQRLTDLQHSIYAVENLVQRIANLLDSGVNVPIELYATAKISGPEMFWQAADNLVQMLGGRGYIENNIAPQLLRDARILRIFEGPTETLSMFFGSRLHKTPTDYLNVMTAHFNANNAANNATNELQHTLASLSEQVSQSNLFATPLDANRWLHERSGKLAALATLNMALNVNEQSKATKHWLSQQFDTLLVQTQQYLHSHADSENKIGSAAYTEQLVAHITQFEQHIGNIEQQASGEDRALDPLLRRDPDAQPEPMQPEPTKTRRGEPLAQNNKVMSEWMQNWVATRLKLSASDVSIHDDFASFGLDSVDAAELTQDLSQAFNIKVKADLAWVYPTINDAAGFLSKESASKESTATFLSKDSTAENSHSTSNVNSNSAKEPADNGKWLEGEI